MELHPNEVTVRTALTRLWNDRDEGALEDLTIQGVRGKGILDPTARGQSLEEYRAFYRHMTTAFPDFQMTILETFVDPTGDKVACRFHVEMTHLGDYMGIPATGRTLAYDAMGILEFEDGLLVRSNTAWDSGQVLAALGALDHLPAFEAFRRDAEG